MAVEDAPGWAVELGFAQVVTVVRGLSPREACQRWGVTKARATRQRFGDVPFSAVDHDPDERGYAWIAAWEVGEATVVWEMATFEGVRPEVLTSVTEGDVSACGINVEPHNWPTFYYAVDGHIRTRLEDVPGARVFAGADAPEVVAAAREAGLTLEAEALFAPGRGRGNTALLQQALMDVVIDAPDPDSMVLAAHIKTRPRPPRTPTANRAGRRGTVHRVRLPPPRD